MEPKIFVKLNSKAMLCELFIYLNENKNKIV